MTADDWQKGLLASEIAESYGQLFSLGIYPKYRTLRLRSKGPPQYAVGLDAFF